MTRRRIDRFDLACFLVVFLTVAICDLGVVMGWWHVRGQWRP